MSITVYHSGNGGVTSGMVIVAPMRDMMDVTLRAWDHRSELPAHRERAVLRSSLDSSDASWRGANRECRDRAHVLLRDMANGVWPSERWSKWSESIDRARRGLEQAMAGAELPAVPFYARQRKWSESGDDAIADIVALGGERGWRETSRDRRVRGSGRITLLIDIGSNSECDASKWCYQAAAVEWIVAELTRKRYRVTVALMSRVSEVCERGDSVYLDEAPGVQRVLVDESWMQCGGALRVTATGTPVLGELWSGKTVCVAILSDGAMPDSEALRNVAWYVSPGFFRTAMFASWTLCAVGEMTYGLGQLDDRFGIEMLARCHGDVLTRPYCLLPRARDAASAVAGIVSALTMVTSQTDAVMTEQAGISPGKESDYQAEIARYEASQRAQRALWERELAAERAKRDERRYGKRKRR